MLTSSRILLCKIRTEAAVVPASCCAHSFTSQHFHNLAIMVERFESRPLHADTMLASQTTATATTLSPTSTAEAKKMPYQRLGKTGLKVSRITLGCMSYGSSKASRDRKRG